MPARSEAQGAQPHGARWRRTVGFVLRAAAMLGVQILTLLLLTAVLPGNDRSPSVRRRQWRS